jgi:hypothetical protein
MILLDEKDAHSTPAFFYNCQRSPLKLLFVPAKRCHNEWRSTLRKNMLPPNLQYARPGGMSQSKCCPEIQVMRKHDMVVDECPAMISIWAHADHLPPTSELPPNPHRSASIPTRVRGSCRRGL